MSVIYFSDRDGHGYLNSKLMLRWVSPFKIRVLLILNEITNSEVLIFSTG